MWQAMKDLWFHGTADTGFNAEHNAHTKQTRQDRRRTSAATVTHSSTSTTTITPCGRCCAIGNSHAPTAASVRSPALPSPCAHHARALEGAWGDLASTISARGKSYFDAQSSPTHTHNTPPPRAHQGARGATGMEGSFNPHKQRAF